MRKVWLMALALLVCVSAIAFNSQAESAGLKGDYVEVRTASVFAGACHYNGEVTTTGREALLAWQVTSGKWRGVDLAGVRVAAIINADDNLSNHSAARRSEVIIDREASDLQAQAMIEALRSQYASSLGQVTSVRRAPISFDHQGQAYSVRVGDLASINIEAMPNDACCKMPHLVWYAPLVPLDHRKVGFTTKALYAGGAHGEAWQRSGENSAFYGSFSF